MAQHDNTIVGLAKILADTRVDTKTVSSALKLICEAFSFDCGAVYESTQTNTLHLAENHVSQGESLCKNILPDKAHLLQEGQLTDEVFVYLKRENNCTPDQTELLELFSSSLLVLAAIADEASSLCGLLVFGKKTADLLSEEDQEALAVLMPMLGRYVGRRMYLTKISCAQRTLENILDNTGVDIYVNDFYNHDILYVNESMAAPYGGKAQFANRKCWEILFPGQAGPCGFCPQKQLIDEEGNPTQVYSWDYQRPFDGSWFRVFSSAFHWVDGRLAHVVCSADITENKRNEELIQYLANYDSLTKLPNRRVLILECENRINQATETEQGYLLFFDIDGFKSINDNLGHDAGDEFLIKLGEFFSGIPMLKDGIYRNGGDEFVAIIGGEEVTKTNIRNLASFVHRRFDKPWVLKNGEVICNTSIGVACYPEDGTDAETLLYVADQAMYRAKKAGGGRICFGYELL